MDVRFRFFIVGIMALVIAAVWTFPQWWVLVNRDSAVADVFPGLETELQADFVALPEADKEAYFEILNGDENATEPDPQPEWARALVRARLTGDDQQAPGSDVPFEAPDGARVLATGEFAAVDAVRSAEGEFTVYQQPDLSRVLRLGDEFRSSRAPDVHLIFTRNPDPTDERGVGDDYFDLGALQGNVGGQTFEVPSPVDFSRYPVVALYSPEYDAVLATAAVR